METIKTQRVIDELEILRLLATLLRRSMTGTRLVTAPASPTK